jgi:hypothetical protein
MFVDKVSDLNPKFYEIWLLYVEFFSCSDLIFERERKSSKFESYSYFKLI